MRLVPAFIRPARQARVPRPRATRLFVTRRRAAMLSLFLVGISVPVVGFLTPGGHDVSAAIAEVFRDPLAVMQGRSPGLRGEGATFQTKPGKERLAALAGRAPVGPEGPVERVLPVVRERPADVVAPPTSLAEPAVLPLGAPGILEPQGVPDDPPAPPLPPIVYPGPDGCCAPIVPPDPNNPPPAVPEPGTWMMMILGFGLVGSAIRRQAAVRRALIGA